jgi:hypothetical protein
MELILVETEHVFDLYEPHGQSAARTIRSPYFGSRSFLTDVWHGCFSKADIHTRESLAGRRLSSVRLPTQSNEAKLRTFCQPYRLFCSRYDHNASYECGNQTHGVFLLCSNRAGWLVLTEAQPIRIALSRISDRKNCAMRYVRLRR